MRFGITARGSRTDREIEPPAAPEAMWRFE